MVVGSDIEVDQTGRAVVINTTDLDLSAGQVATALDPYQPLVAAMVRWTGEVHSRRGGLLDRDRFVTPGGTFSQIRLARQALSDDIVGNVAETTESLAFKRIGFSVADRDQEDAWNQWAGTVNLDARLREAWRILFTDSQFVMALWWGRRDYKIRGRTDAGVPKRKTFSLQVPVGLTFLDSLKVVPVGSFMFGQERLAYIASREEAAAFDKVLLGPNAGPLRLERPLSRPFTNIPTVGPGEAAIQDPIVERLIESKYEPSLAERKWMREEGVEPTRLYLLREDSVFRHTQTRPQYERFARVRMESVFELLDVKHQLRQMDRAHLLAGTNFIILIKQGTDKEPAEPEEIAYLRANVRTIANVPVIVSDHRLAIEIVTPKLDTTLNRERYDTVDARILARLYRMLVPTGGGQGGQDVEKLGKVIGANLQSERHMVMRTLEEKVFDAIRTRNPELDERSKMRFYPARISLEFDGDYASFLLDLRDTGDVSRDTVLSSFEFDQEHEARMLEREAEHYDGIFLTHKPFDSPANLPENRRTAPGNAPPATSPAAQRRAGRRQGGTRGGGGAAPGSGQGQAPRRPRSRSDGGTPSRAELLARAKELDIKGRTRMTDDALLSAIDEADDDGQED